MNPDPIEATSVVAQITEAYALYAEIVTVALDAASGVRAAALRHGFTEHQADMVAWNHLLQMLTKAYGSNT